MANEAPKKTVQRRPSSAPKSQKAAAPKAAAPKKQIRRAVPQEETQQRIYTTVKGKGGVMFRLRTAGIQYSDPETRSIRELRYCPMESSVFADEQSDLALVGHVWFENKVLSVRPDQYNLIDFLDRHPGNRANGGKLFELVNNVKSAEDTVADEFLVHDAISMIKSNTIEDLLPVAMAYGININKDDMTIKRALLNVAKKKPAEFMAKFDDPVVMARAICRQALDQQIVKDAGASVNWFDSGSMICAIPAGKSAIDVLSRFMLTDAGATVLAEIESQLGM